MSTHRHIDKICLAAALLSLLLTLVFANSQALGVQAASKAMGYEDRLFDTSRVHTIDIVMDDWDGFLETCENEEYSVCSVVIDGTAYKNVGIRAKGNSSLSSVAKMDSDRYSFKIEFDQYDSTKSYYGLDKLSLNNIIQDNTYMKDYLTYQMMGDFGVKAPLCSYAYLTVNGEDWGLYLAVEAIEDAFLQRNYGNDAGQLYKPDSAGMGGGRNNGKDFNMEDFWNAQGEEPAPEEAPLQADLPEEEAPAEGQGERPNRMPPPGEGGMGGFGGMGSADIKLQYIDDNPESYENIFNNAKTDITEEDQARLIQSLRSLSEGENIENVVDVEAVIRYFVVHNFVCNGDSYTGSMVHNYYLYEKDGQLSMLPWDYNLAFGSFQSSSAADSVNAPIDTPVSGGAEDDRPMVDWIFDSTEYTQLYHQYFGEFLENTDFAAMIDETAALIAPYVEKDPTKFCTYQQFEAGVSALRQFCLLREESVSGQLDGSIPSTREGQAAEPSALIDASSVSISDMGSTAMGDRGGMGGDRAEKAPPGQGAPLPNRDGASAPEAPGRTNVPDGADFPGGVSDRSPAPSEAGETVQNSTEPAILLGVSLLALVGGLLAAFKYRR